MTEKLWGGRFSKATDATLEEFGASIGFDQRLAKWDIRGSIAHSRMLSMVGAISEAEADKIIDGLNYVRGQIEAGDFVFKTELEDIHMNVESALTDYIGQEGKKLHTARSRNDQVALDCHLFMLDACQETVAAVRKLQAALLELAEQHQQIFMPGYTHLQRAQPVLFAHHLLAHFWALERDAQRFCLCRKSADCSPLGAGALAGTSFPIAPAKVAADLGFSSIYDNSMDAVSDRDYMLEYMFAAALLMVHLSRMGEEIILWNSTEFNFIDLDDSFSTGSSIMPQKKNPDAAELVRGKSGRAIGNLVALLTVIKGLPLAYNKDMQEDKEPLFDSIDTVLGSLNLFAGMYRTMTPNRQAMETAATNDFAGATDVADFLAKNGVPFREAHGITGKIVRDAIAQGRLLGDLSVEEWQSYSPLFTAEIRTMVLPENVIGARKAPMGTAPENVAAQLAKAKCCLQNP